jgi:hypothetical protein
MRTTAEIDSDGPRLEPAAIRCLEQTRSGVLNVLVGIGVTIAISGWLLRGREPETPWLTARAIHQGLTVAWIAIGSASYLARRLLARRSVLSDPARRAWRFYWSHVIAAAIGAMILPLGLVQGWFCDSALEAVIPFWILPLTLGVLALPRSAELAGFSEPMTAEGASPT